MYVELVVAAGGDSWSCRCVCSGAWAGHRPARLGRQHFRAGSDFVVLGVFMVFLAGTGIARNAISDRRVRRDRQGGGARPRFRTPGGGPPGCGCGPIVRHRRGCCPHGARRIRKPARAARECGAIRWATASAGEAFGVGDALRGHLPGPPVFLNVVRWSSGSGAARTPPGQP